MLLGLPPKSPSILLAGVEAPLHPPIEAAARRVFREPQFRVFATLEHALRSERWQAPEILVLARPDPDSVTKAAAAVDGSNLPRWAAALFGEAEIGSLFQPDSNLASAVLSAALERHELERQIAILRGSLWSVGRRVAHDLRTPLGCVVTAAEALGESLDGPQAEAPQNVNSILDSADEMEKTISRVAFLARACGTPPVKNRFDMGTAFWMAFQRLEMQIVRQRALIVQPSSWPEVCGESTWLEVVWWNLLANAMKHAGTAGKIEAGWQKEGRNFQFWVDDSGPGVPFESQRKLFFPFHRLHEPNAPGGLGLPSVQCLISALDGECGYQAAPSGGARFFFTLPDGDSCPAAGN